MRASIWLGYDKWKAHTLATNSIHSSEFHTDILLNTFSVFLVSVCLKKKNFTPLFHLIRRGFVKFTRMGERENISQIPKKFSSSFTFAWREPLKRIKKWEARKGKGGKPVSLTKKCKVRKQRLLTSPSLARCPHLGFWTTARYRKLLPSTVHIRRLTPQGAETGILCQHHKLKKTWLHMFYQCKCIEMVEI